MEDPYAFAINNELNFAPFQDRVGRLGRARSGTIRAHTLSNSRVVSLLKLQVCDCVVMVVVPLLLINTFVFFWSHNSVLIAVTFCRKIH